MNAKNIEIRMAVTGSDQAAADVNKTSDAMENLDDNVSKIARTQKAQAISQLADMVGNLGGKFIAAAGEVESFDAELANTLRNTGENISKVSGAVNSLAMGFAVGGPLGAGIAGIGVLLAETANAWAFMAEAEANAARSGERAAEMAQRLANARATYAVDIQNDRVLERLQEEARALDDQIDRMERLREVEKARDKADSAERDLQDAEAIRNGADPEAIKIQRAKDDAEKATAEVDEGVADAKAVRDSAAKKAQAAYFDENRISQDPNASEKDKKAAADAFEKARQELEAADNDFRVTSAKAPEQKREIAARTTNQVRELEARQLERYDREQRQKELENNRLLQERDRDQMEAAENRLDSTARRDGRRFQNAGNFVGGSLGKTLGGIGNQLADGTDEKEIAQLREQFIAATKGFGGETVTTMRAMLEAQMEQAREIAILKAQIKNARSYK